MKRYLICLVILALVLTGCAGAAPQETGETAASQTVPVSGETTLPRETAQPAAGSYDLSEEGAVDDSFTFRWVREPDDKNIQRYFLEDMLQDYLDKWLEDGALVEENTQWTLEDGVAGWILISGTPRQDLGWNTLERDGKALYCRHIQIRHIPHSQQYQFLQTTPSPDLKQPDPVTPLDHDFFGIEDQGLQLPALLGAELYRDGVCYRMEDPEQLAILKKGLDLPPQLRMLTFQARPEPEGEGDILILDLEGQGKRMVRTEPEGGPGCDIWGGHLLLSPVSIYELFGVPGESRGYGPREAEGRRVTVERIREDIPYPLRYQYVLDEKGNILSHEDLTDDAELAWREPVRDSFTYDAESRMLTHETARGDKVSRDLFRYDSQGRLEEEVHNAGEDYEERIRCLYDAQGRITARVLLDEKGEEVPTGSVYFWYDDAGVRHGFWYRENGEAGGDPPDAPLRRP